MNKSDVQEGCANGKRDVQTVGETVKKTVRQCRAVKKNLIFVEFKIKIHIRMQNAAFEF